MMRRSFRPRVGFTLVELLVVMAIIVVLAGLLVAMLPSLASATAEANGAANLQGWLNVARQKAIRNQSPFGLRLWVKDLTTMLVSDLQYIEQPDDFAGSTASPVQVTTSTTAVPNDTILFSPAVPGGQNIDLTGGFGANSDQTLWPVQVNDYLEVMASGQMHRIIGIDGVNQRVQLASGIPFPIGLGAINWRIMRQPRPIGEETLSLPDGVYVDLSSNTSIYGNPPWIVPDTLAGNIVGAHADILFSPAGSVSTPGRRSGHLRRCGSGSRTPARPAISITSLPAHRP